MKQKRIFIAVASKTGTTMRCAIRLAGLLSDHSVEVCDLTREQPSPAGYDLVIVGGSIRLGRLHPAARRYIRSHQALLQNEAFATAVQKAESPCPPDAQAR